MTHGAGFDEVGGLLLIYEPREPHPLREELKRWMPPRVTAPGSIPAYSNYGADLAGYIVQRVSGEPVEAYIERHIFDSLGMTQATFRQPLPQALAPWMSKGYPLASGDPKPFEIDTTQPDGALSASGGDMGRFMIAHLQNGAFGTSRILKEATAVRMHTTALEFLPPLNRMLLGFYENNLNGHRVITHGGDLQWFHSELNLFIDDGVGVFVSLNSLGKDGAAEQIRTGFFREFSDRYFPAPLPEGSVDPKTAAANAHLITGRYISSRRPHEPRRESPPACSHRFTVVHVDGYCVGGFNQDFLGRHGMDRSTYQSLDQTAARVVISNRFCQQRDRGLESRDVTARSAQMACETLGRGHRDFLSGTALCRGCFPFGWLQRQILISFPNQTYECYQFPRPP